MVITLDSHIVRYTSTDIQSAWPHIEAWLVAHCAGKMSMLAGPVMNQIDIIFETESDTMIWLMAWGGEYLQPYITKTGICW
jgi:hypothetical protein